MSYWGSVDLFEIPAEKADSSLLYLVMLGSVLTFFAFIGFEDTINVAEECKNPQVTIPVALPVATAIAAVLYIAVAITAVSVVPWAELAAAPAPLGAVMDRGRSKLSVGRARRHYAFCRRQYGARQLRDRLAPHLRHGAPEPSACSAGESSRRAPDTALGDPRAAAVFVPLALMGSITELASATVLLLLFVFMVVNAALAVLKKRPGEPKGAFEIPILIPVFGAVVCGVLIVFRVSTGTWQAPAIAGVLLAAIVVIYAWLRPKPLDE